MSSTKVVRAMISNPVFCILPTPSSGVHQVFMYIQTYKGRKKTSLQNTISIYSDV